jgi:OFA family oxalate/formate antiporter-like MFS transporter
MSTQSETVANIHGSKTSNRWIQLVLGIICMAMIANLQYGWTLFVNPMHDKMGWTKAAIQVAFSVFVLTETWLVPVEGWAMDKFGPRPVVMFGAVLVAAAWVMNSMANSLELLYFAAVVGGVGAGCVYGTCVGNALKLFPDKRGLAAGLTAAGFGAGAAITVIPISHMVHTAGYQQAFFTFGLLQGGVILVLALFLVRAPLKAAAATSNKTNPLTQHNYTSKEMLKTPVFWLLYLCFVLVAAGGIMAAAQVAPIAKDYGVATLPLDVFGSTMPLLTLVLVMDSLCNGFTRPLTGWISDKLGRENTMLLVFTGEGIAILGLMEFGHNPIGFMIFAPMIFLCWGEIFSIFPAVSGDTFGTKYAAANFGFLYTAKGTASLLVPLASVLKATTGSWVAVLWVAAIMSVTAAVLARFVISPMRKKMIAGKNEVVAASLQPA